MTRTQLPTGLHLCRSGHGATGHDTVPALRALQLDQLFPDFQVSLTSDLIFNSKNKDTEPKTKREEKEKEVGTAAKE